MDTRKTIIGATLSFGLVNIEVGVTKAHGRNSIKLRTLHEACGSTIKQENRCPECHVTVGPEDEAKGFQVSSKVIIPIDKDELEKFAVERSGLIELHKFVPANSIPPLLVEKLYYLKANENLPKPYDLLVAALKKKKVVGIGFASLWGSEKPVAIESDGSGLSMKMLYCVDEIIPPLETPPAKVNAEELKVALQIIGVQEGALDNADLTSKSRERMGEYIASVVEGKAKEPGPAEKLPEPTVDLMAALRETLATV